MMPAERSMPVVTVDLADGTDTTAWMARLPDGRILARPSRDALVDAIKREFSGTAIRFVPAPRPEADRPVPRPGGRSPGARRRDLPPVTAPDTAEAPGGLRAGRRFGRPAVGLEAHRRRTSPRHDNRGDETHG